MFKLIPSIRNENLVIEPIERKNVKDYTGKSLSDVETNSMDILQFGKILYTNDNEYKIDDIVLYEKLAAHKTNIGSPRQILVNSQHVQAKLKEI